MFMYCSQIQNNELFLLFLWIAIPACAQKYEITNQTPMTCEYLFVSYKLWLLTRTHLFIYIINADSFYHYLLPT